MQLHHKCGHPSMQTFRLKGKGKTFTYCLFCLVEKLGLDNLENFDNPFINVSKPKEKVKEVKKATTESPEKKEK